jgi:hypothetical protein
VRPLKHTRSGRSVRALAPWPRPRG